METEKRSSGAAYDTDRSRRRVHVFVSSPADCANERRVVREVLQLVNRTHESGAARLRFEALLWEDLPGGAGPKGDEQSRIDAVLQRTGLRDFEVYLGIMRAGAGSPTQSGETGTVHEFHDALRRRGRRGLPSEMLFYFVGDARERGEDVEAFRKKLREVRFLFHDAPDTDAFAQALETHLIHVASGWRSARNRIRRLRRHLPVAGSAAFSVLVLFLGGLYLRYDLGGLRAVEEATRAGPGDALEQWRRVSSDLFFHATAAKARVDELLARTLEGEGSLEESLALFPQWRATVAADFPPVVSARSVLASRTAHQVSRLARAQRVASAFALIRSADVAGIWDESVRGRTSALRAAGVHAFLEALAAQGVELVSRMHAETRPFESEALRAETAAALAEPEGMRESSALVQLAAALACSEWSTLERLANEAVEREEPVPPVVELFVARAPVEHVERWIEHELRRGLPGHVFGKIVDGARSRGSLTIALQLLDATIAGSAPYEFLDTDTESFLGVAETPQSSRELALRILGDWIPNEERPESSVLEMVLPHIRAEDVPESQRDALVVWLGESVENEPAAIDLVARLRTSLGERRLERLLAEYVDGRDYGGSPQRSALIRWLRASGAPLTRARLLSEITLEVEADEPAHDIVHAEYLRWVASRPSEISDQVPHLRRLIEHRAARPEHRSFPFRPGGVWLWQQELDDAFLGILANASVEDVLRLLDPGEGWEPVAEFDGRWDRWRYVCASLVERPAPWSPVLVDSVSSILPDNEDLSGAFRRLLARRGGERIRIVLQRTLAVSAPRTWPLYGLAQDVESVTWLVDHVSGGEHLDELVASVLELNDPARTRLLERLCVRFSDGPFEKHVLGLVQYYGADLLAIGPSVSLAPALRYAEDLLASSKDGDELTRAVAYLARAAPERMAATLDRPAIAEHLRAVLRGVDEARWVFFTQEIELHPERPVPDVLFDLIRDRCVVSTLNPDQIAEDPPRFEVAGRVILCSLLERLAGRAPERAAPLLRAIAAEPSRVEGAGDLEAPQAGIRGFALWLLAGCAARSAPVAEELLRDPQILLDATSENPYLARAAAGALLGATRR